MLLHRPVSLTGETDMKTGRKTPLRMLLEVKGTRKELSCYQKRWLCYCFTCGCDKILDKADLRKEGLHPLLPTEGGNLALRS